MEKTQRPPAKALPQSFRLQHPRPLAPARPHQHLPLPLVQHPDRQPPLHRHRIRLLDQSLQRIHRHRKAQVVRLQRLQRQHPHHLPHPIQNRPTTVPPLDGQRHLQHRHALDVHLPQSRHHTLHHTELQPLRIAHRHQPLPLHQRGRITQPQRLQPLAFHLQHRQIQLRIRRMDRLHLQHLPTRQFHLQRPRLTDHMQIRRDQPLV